MEKLHYLKMEVQRLVYSNLLTFTNNNQNGESERLEVKNNKNLELIYVEMSLSSL